MADGKIRITLEARQAQQVAEQLAQRLRDLGSAASGAGAATENLGNRSKKSSQSQKQLLATISSINTQVRQLAATSGASNTTLTQLNATVNKMAQSHRDLVAAVQSAVAALNNLRAAGNSAAQGVDNNTSSLDRMGKSMSSVYSKARLLKEALVAVGAGLSLSYALKTLADFDHGMAQVEAISRATGSSLDTLREKAKELGATTVYTSGEAAQGMKFLAQSGFETNEILAAAGPVLALAQAGDIGLAQAAEIAAKALRGFRLEATQMSDVADVMAAAVTQSTMNIQELGYAFKYVAPIAASMGVNIREASAYIGVLSDAGIDATMAGTSLRRIISDLANPTTKTTKILKAHGLTISDVDIRARGLTDVMHTLIDANIGVGESFAMFGLRGAPGFQVLSQQIDVVEKKHKNLMDVQGRAKEMQDIMNQSLLASFKNLTSAIEFLIIQFAEETGALGQLKSGIFGAAEGVRTLARNMEIVAPVVGALAATQIPGLIAALLRLTRIYDVTGRSQVTFVGNVKNMANGVKAATTVMGGLKAGLSGIMGILGGPLNIALMAAGAAFLYYATAEDAATKAGEKFKDLLDAQKKGTDEYTKAIDEFNSGIQKLDEASAIKGYDQSIEQLDALRKQLHETANEAFSFKSKIVDFFNENDEHEMYKRTAAAVREMVNEYQRGDTTLDQLKDKLLAHIKILPETAEESRQLVLQVIDVADKMGLAGNAADQYRIRLAILRGETQSLTEEQKKLANQMTVVKLLRQEAINETLDQTASAEYAIETYKQGINLSKEAFNDFQRARKLQGKTLGTEQADYYKLVQTESGAWQNVLKSEIELTERQRELVNTGQVKLHTDAELKILNERLQKEYELTRLKKQRAEKDKEEAKALKESTSSAKSYSRAVSRVNEDLARMTMTDREFQQFKFEQELAKLGKTVGQTNPKFQELIELWQTAKDLGLASPKEIMAARTSFDDWLKVQEHGGDEKWSKKALIDEQAKYLEQFYKEDAAKAVKIKQWAEDEKRKISSGSLQKDTEAQMQFWSDYVDLTGQGMEKYNQLLDQMYQEQYQKYLALCNDEVAAREAAERKKLLASKKGVDGMKAATQDWIKENTDQAKMMYTITKNFYDGLSDALTDMVISGKANWEDLGRTVLRELTNMIIKSMILANILRLMGMIGGAMFGGDSGGGGMHADTSSMVASLGNISYQAKGGVFTGGNISDFSGSVVGTPTAFDYGREMTQFARGGAVMGEAGWEGIFPLGRNSRGELGIKADVSGDSKTRGAGDVTVNIFNYSDQNARQETKTDGNGGKTIDVWIGDMAADQMNKPGSNLNKAMRNVTGIKQQVTRR